MICEKCPWTKTLKGCGGQSGCHQIPGAFFLAWKDGCGMYDAVRKNDKVLFDKILKEKKIELGFLPPEKEQTPVATPKPAGGAYHGYNIGDWLKVDGNGQGFIPMWGYEGAVAGLSGAQGEELLLNGLRTTYYSPVSKRTFEKIDPPEFSEWADPDGDPRIVEGSTIILCRHREYNGTTYWNYSDMDHLVGKVTTAGIVSKSAARTLGLTFINIADTNSAVWWRKDCIWVCGP